MATFPLLKTSAVAQYPVERAMRYRTQLVSFLDGSQQRFSLAGAGLRKWTIALQQLDLGEVAALVEFTEAQGSAVFSYSDPISGDVAAKCVIAAGGMTTTARGEVANNAELVIEEIA